MRTSAHWLTKKDVAARLRVHPETVTRLLREGRLPPALKFGEHGACRWPQHVIDDWERAELAKIGIVAGGAACAA